MGEVVREEVNSKGAARKVPLSELLQKRFKAGDFDQVERYLQGTGHTLTRYPGRPVDRAVQLLASVYGIADPELWPAGAAPPPIPVQLGAHQAALVVREDGSWTLTNTTLGRPQGKGRVAAGKLRGDFYAVEEPYNRLNVREVKALVVAAWERYQAAQPKPEPQKAARKGKAPLSAQAAYEQAQAAYNAAKTSAKRARLESEVRRTGAALAAENRRKADEQRAAIDRAILRRLDALQVVVGPTELPEGGGGAVLGLQVYFRNTPDHAFRYGLSRTIRIQGAPMESAATPSEPYANYGIYAESQELARGRTALEALVNYFAAAAQQDPDLSTPIGWAAPSFQVAAGPVVAALDAGKPVIWDPSSFTASVDGARYPQDVLLELQSIGLAAFYNGQWTRGPVSPRARGYGGAGELVRPAPAVPPPMPTPAAPRPAPAPPPPIPAPAAARERISASTSRARAAKAQAGKKKDPAEQEAAATRRKEEAQQKAAAKAQREQQAAARQSKLVLQHAQKIAARKGLHPNAKWEARFWEAVKLLHPEIQWTNRSREEIYSTILPLWRAHRWGPEEAAQAVCLRCGVPSDPPQAAPVASRGRTLEHPIYLTAEVRRRLPRASVLRPAHRDDLPDDLPALPPAAAAARVPARAQLPGISCPPERAECNYSVKGGACSVAARLALGAKTGLGIEQVPARYCLLEISALKTSHQPLRGFQPDPDYPAGAQERDYQLKGERLKVEEIARDYDPSLIFNTSPGAIDGVPVACDCGYVLGGNGRMMATRLVYAGLGGVPADTPRQYLIDHAYEFGFDRETVEQFDQPMLVRTIKVDDPRDFPSWSRRLNVSLSVQLDGTRLAVSRARIVPQAALDELAASMDDDETLVSFLSAQRSRRFVQALQQSGVIDGRASSTYLQDDGLLNQQGRDLVADLLVAVLVPDAGLIEAYGRGPVGTLARAAPYLVRAASDGGDWDLREPLRKAVRDRVSMKRHGFTTVDSFLAQGGLFGMDPRGDQPQSRGDARATALLRVLEALDGSPVKLGKFARAFVELSAANPRAQGALFAAEKIEPAEALQIAAGQLGVKL